MGQDGNIYEESSLNCILTPEDFAREYGRPRTPAEEQEYRMFNDMAMLADPDTHLTAGEPGSGDEDCNP